MTDPYSAELLTATRLRELLEYDPATGAFAWLATRGGKRSGCIAGCLNKAGYRIIRVDKGQYLAHRLAYLFAYGEWPVGELDHINRVKHDNSIVNLRLATKSENAQNVGLRRDNASGIKGVSFAKRRGRWQAHVRVNGNRVALGYFDSPEEAGKAAETMRVELHGAFACNDRSGDGQ